VRVGKYQIFCILIVAACQPAVAETRIETDSNTPYDVEFVSHDTPTEMKAGERTLVPIVIRNLGTLTWAPTGRIRLSYHWLTTSGEMLVLDGFRTELGDVVAPGEELALQAVVVAPVDAGDYLLQWDLVHEGVCWFAQKDPTPLDPVHVRTEYLEPSHGFTMLEHDTPKLMWAGSVSDVSVRLQNDGKVAWMPNASFKLSYHWQKPDGAQVVFEGRRSRIEVRTEPGQQVEMVAQVRAPRRWGRLVIRWDMVEENVCWFSQHDPTPMHPITIWILPKPWSSASVPLIVAVALAIGLLVVLRRDRVPTWVVEVLALADVLWLAVSLFVKQQVVLTATARQAAPGSGWLVVSGIAIVVICLMLLPRLVRPFVSWAAAIFVSFVFLADVLYLRFFGDVISFAAIGSAGQTAQIRESIIALFSAGELWLLADVVAAGIVVAATVSFQKRTTSRWRYYVAAALLPVLVPGGLTAWRIATATEGRLVQVFQNTILVSELGALNYHVYDGFLAARSSFLRPPLSPSKYRMVRNWFEETRSTRRGVGPHFGVARGKNLLMLQVESMQGFVVGLEINGQQVTPNLNRWTNAALWFPNCTDQTAFGRTSDGELATQASLFPARRGAAAFRFANNDFVGLAEILEEHGYNTMSAVPFRGDFWNRRVVHSVYGYKNLLFRKQFEPGMTIGWGLNDRDFLHQMVAKLAAADKPFGALLITLSNHHPFSGFPVEEKTLDVGELEGTPMGNYLHTMHFFDQALYSFVEELAAASLLENTVVAIWGDHNAGFAWDEEFTRVIKRPYSEASYYYSDRVPLFVYVPGQSHLRGTQNRRCGQLDIAPTLLALMGIDPQNEPMIGRNLLGDPGPGPVARIYGTWLGGGLIFVNRGATFEEGTCYDELSFEVVPLQRCAELDAEARRALTVGDLVLRFDLQERLRKDLMEGNTVQ
jgi:phosphoglycerol transferase MdoB-like AlkP superfamily enzyme